MYCCRVKKRVLDRYLLRYGWRLVRQGGNHEMWTNGEHLVPVPCHKEINEFTARGIMKKVKDNPAQR